MYSSILHLILCYISFLLTSVVCELFATKPLWTWECIDAKCVPKKASISQKLQSLMTCNKLCCAFLWPQPTGNVTLSTTAVPFTHVKWYLNKRPHRMDFENDYAVLLQDFYEYIKTINKTNYFLDSENIFTIFINTTVESSTVMKFNTDESYSLIINKKIDNAYIVHIFAGSFIAVVHALETLKQLIWYDEYADSLLIFEAASVTDAPRFRYRGLMVDTTQFFLPVDEMTDVIKAMSTCKLNTFHWHIDAIQMMAWIDKMLVVKSSAYTRPFMYTYENAVYIVDFAHRYGVRVLLEINSPSQIGDVFKWGISSGMGELTHCTDPELWPIYCDEPPCGQFNPNNDHVYDILERIYKIIIELTGTRDIFHMSGYGISKFCWKQYFNGSDPKDLWIHFISKALKRLEKANKYIPPYVLLWSSNFTDGIKSALKKYRNYIVLQIRNEQYVTKLSTVLSHEDVWDFKSEAGIWYETNGGVKYNTWQRVYDHRPWTRHSTGKILGGEGTTWSTNVWAGNMLGQIWHRLAALSERLWSDPAIGVSPQVTARLDVFTQTCSMMFTDKLVPLWSEWCSQHPFTCS